MKRTCEIKKLDVMLNILVIFKKNNELKEVLVKV